MWGVGVGGTMRRAAKSTRHLTSYCIGALVVLAIRWSVGGLGPKFGSGRYDLQFGKNIAENAILTLAGWTMPFSSVNVFLAVRNGQVLRLALMAFATAAFMAVVTWGAWRAPRVHRRAIFVLLTIAISGVFPSLFMHMSELYIYNSMPFVSILVGIGVGTFVAELLRSKLAHRHVAEWVVISAIAVLFAAHGLAVREKVALMRRQGNQAASLLNQIAAHAVNLPHSGQLILLDLPSNTLKYSVYVQDGFDPIREGTDYVKAMIGRPDIRVDVYDSIDAGIVEQLPPEATVLSLAPTGYLHVVERR
jgi:hypothetical protein